jgi:hypothetical protein
VSEPLSRAEGTKLYLEYLDKEMTIMGILSAFCAAVLGLVLGVVAKTEGGGDNMGAQMWAKGHWFIVVGSIALIAAVLFFYRQRSHLAWYYGQICLTLALGKNNELDEWLTDADGWDTWIHYRWGFVTASIGICAYGHAIVSVINAWFGSVYCLVAFLLLSVACLCLIRRQTVLLRQHPQSDDPVYSLRVFFGLSKHPESKKKKVRGE